MKEKNKEILRAVKFTLFSISAGIIQILSYTLISELFKVEHWLANTISLILSVIWNFTINRKVTFKASNNLIISMLLIALFYLVFTPVSSFLGEWAVVKGGWNRYVVEGLTMVANFVLEFLYSRFVVYRNSCDTAKNA